MCFRVTAVAKNFQSICSLYSDRNGLNKCESLQEDKRYLQFCLSIQFEIEGMKSVLSYAVFTILISHRSFPIIPSNVKLVTEWKKSRFQVCCVCVVLKKSASNQIHSKYFRSVVSGLYVSRLCILDCSASFIPRRAIGIRAWCPHNTKNLFVMW